MITLPGLGGQSWGCWAVLGVLGGAGEVLGCAGEVLGGSGEALGCAGGC